MSAQASRPRVLIVSALQVYPTLSGGNLRTHALASALAKRGAEVFVYSFVGRKKDYLARTGSGVQTWPGGLDEHVNRSLPGFLAGYGSYVLGLPPLWLTAYLRVASAWLRDLLLPRLLREKLAWCDVVIADFPFVHPVFDARAARGRLRVLNTHNIEHHLYPADGTWRDRLLRRFVQSTELQAASRADVVVGCSEADTAFFSARTRVRHAVVVPNGVDVRRFDLPAEVRRATRAALGVPEGVLLVLFTASKWGPNQEAFDFLHGFAQRHERELVENRIHFLVVGGIVDAPLRMRALTATGRVATVEAYFAAADVGVNPLVTGAGTNVKMGEYIAARLPVLVTTFGARGYRVDDGRNGFVFDRDRLLDCLVELHRKLDADPRSLKAVAELAFGDNADLIDMNECVTPLIERILSRVAKPSASLDQSLAAGRLEKPHAEPGQPIQGAPRTTGEEFHREHRRESAMGSCMTTERTPATVDPTASTPMVSIIVNNFNYAKFLPQCIQSALDQTHPRVEVVVADDASTDNSQELIRAFGGRVVPVLQAVNGGQAAAMNAGFAASRGDVVIFLDADDYLYPDAAERVAQLFRPGVAMVQYRLHFVDVAGTVIDLYPSAEIMFDTGDVTKKLARTGRIEGTVTSGLAFSRSALVSILPIPEDRYRIAADGYLITAVPFQGEVRAIEQPLGAYRRHGGSAWTTSSNVAGGFRRAILHDGEKHKDLRRHAAQHGIEAQSQPGLRDYQHLSARLGSLLLERAKHPMPGDSRFALGMRGAWASLRAPMPRTFRLLLSIWFVGLGALPWNASRGIFLWRFEPAARPQRLTSVIRFLRRKVGA